MKIKHVAIAVVALAFVAVFVTFYKVPHDDTPPPPAVADPTKPCHFTAGSVLTLSQWNACFDSKQDKAP
jgi:hypothetical protein